MYRIGMAVKGHTTHALLGLLTYHPMSGYDIRRLIPESVGHFWDEGYGNIYPALKSLTDQGFVTRATEQTIGKPDRYVYALTDAGREELSRWLGQPVTPPTPRNELLLKLFFGAHAATEVSREHVIAWRESHAAAMKLYQATVRKLKEKEIKDPQLPFWLITLSYGRHMCAATIAWCDETLDVLKNLRKTPVRRHK